MAPASVLGKRSGPIEGTEASILETMPGFSATPGSSLAPSASSSSSSSSSESFQAQPTMSSTQSQLLQHFGHFIPNQYANNRLPQYMAAPAGNNQMYGNEFYPASASHMLFPQSPPQEQFMAPPLDDFGEKRRKVSGYGDLSSTIINKQQQQQLQQLQQQQQQQLHQQHQLQQQQQLYQQQLQQQQQRYFHESFTHQPAAASAPRQMPAGNAQPVTLPGSMAVPQHPQLLRPAPAVVSKPSIAPSIIAPPPRKNYKPQTITLPKVVDGAWPEDCDDKDGHYIVKSGERFAGRYMIVKLLGQGTFGKVAQAWDERTQEHCAIKIIRAVPKYRDASKIELRVLSLLSSCDPQGLNRCVRMRECFDYRDHVCIVTDLHDISVYDFLKDNQFMPFPGRHIRDFARQILLSVAHIHSLGVVHTDLKPENILLSSSKSVPGTYRRVSPSPSTSSASSATPRSRRASRKELRCTDVTLIDFGSAIFDDEYHSSVVSTRHYRAPEIIFGTGWTYACDLWSIGCVLIELCTGKVLFETRDNLEHLHMMEKTLGKKFSCQQLTAASSTTEGSPLVTTRSWFPKLKPLTQQPQIDSVANMRTVMDLIHSYTSPREKYFWDGFLDLISKLLTLDPAQRMTAAEALQHPWVASNL